MVYNSNYFLQMKATILKIHSEIIRCAVERDRLYIDVNCDAAQDVKEEIERRLKTKLKGIKYVIQYTTEGIIDFALPVSRGDRVGCSNCVFGTIGCFVRGRQNAVFALTSKHVVDSFPGATVLGEQLLGHTVRPHAELYDIAAVQVTDGDRGKISLRWTDDRGRNVCVITYRYEDQELDAIRDHFDLVFIRGANTNVGKGEIISCARDRHGCKILYIKDSTNTRGRFSQQGDSGAIVLAKGADHRVYALAILKGFDNFTSSYIAHMLQDGLEELSRKHRTNYRLTGDNNNSLSLPAL